tara:strand:+ start:218058 stop:219437 length:1380 start_codon:yes stop_codon:yes gene_type:complete
LNLVEISRKFIAIDSSHSQGTSDLVNFIEELCAEYKLFVDIQDEVLEGRKEKNIIIRPHAETMSGELLLQTHLDTPDPGIYSLWTKTGSNPFDGSIYGDELYGLGVADVKLDFLCKLMAMIQGIELGHTPNAVLVGTFAGGSSMAGAVKLIRRGKINASHALVGHPTELKLINASAGYAAVEITIPFSDEEMNYHREHDLRVSSSCQSKMFYGEAGHSSHTLLKENAIINMMEFLGQLPEGIAVLDMEGGSHFNAIPESAVLEFDIMGGFKQPTVVVKTAKIVEIVKQVEAEFENFPCEGFTPSVPTLNIGTVKKQKDYLRFTGSCRITPNIAQNTYEEWMGRIDSVCKEVGATFRIVDYKSAFSTKEDSRFLKLAKTALQSLDVEVDVDYGKISATTEASVFHRMGIQCLVFGAGTHANNSHEPNEKVSLRELQHSVDFYEKILQNYNGLNKSNGAES